MELRIQARWYTQPLAFPAMTPYRSGPDPVQDPIALNPHSVWYGKGPQDRPSWRHWGSVAHHFRGAQRAPTLEESDRRPGTQCGVRRTRSQRVPVLVTLCLLQPYLRWTNF